jgi:hypothetical protein
LDKCKEKLADIARSLGDKQLASVSHFLIVSERSKQGSKDFSR